MGSRPRTAGRRPRSLERRPRPVRPRSGMTKALPGGVQVILGTFPLERWFGGTPAAQLDPQTGTVDWYFTDHLGTPLIQTSATATITWCAEHDPYGTVHTYRTGATKYQPLRFPGQENDGEAETSYNIFRWRKTTVGTSCLRNRIRASAYAA